MSASEDPAPLRFNETQAARIITVDETELARSFFDALGTPCATAAARSFPSFKMALLIRNPDNYGLYFYHQQTQTPFLWFGLAWSSGDPPGTLPSWGASLEVNGDALGPFEEDRAGLKGAMESLSASEDNPLQVYRFDEHVELAQWLPFSWLLQQEDQVAALQGFWQGFLQLLAAAGLSGVVAEFIQQNDGA